MCGRFTLTADDLASLAREWAAEVEEAASAGWRPRFNVAPGDRHPVLVAGGDAERSLRGSAGSGAGSFPGGRRLISATFGWRGGEAGLLINARAETAGTLPAFREAFRARRAAVPADGFYEWEGPAAARRPTWFHLAPGRPMLFAALLGEAPGGGPGFVILTTEARAPVAALHDRMPLILPPALLDAWLAGPPPALPVPADGALQARPVSDRVNAVKNDDAACLAPPAPPAQGRLF